MSHATDFEPFARGREGKGGEDLTNQIRPRAASETTSKFQLGAGIATDPAGYCLITS